MVDEFSSEREQAEALKKWLKTHGPSIVIGVVIGLAAIGGWRYWQNYQQGLAEQASVHFGELNEALSNDDLDAARGVAVTLREDYSSSAYSALAALLFARRAAESGDNAAAIEQLRWLIDSGSQPELIPIARLRLARLLFAEDQLDEARAQIDQLEATGFDAEAEELSGDLYAAAGQPDLARSAYQAAQAASGRLGAGGSLLQLKIDNLPAATQ